MYNNNETVRETLERVMREKGYLQPENQITLQTPIGDFTYEKNEQTQTPWNNYQTTQNQTLQPTSTPWNTTSTQLQISSQPVQTSNVWSEQNGRNVENDLLMNGMDVLYGINRSINGMTFGGLDWVGNQLGFDTQMNDYLKLKNPQERELTQAAGQLAQLGGGVLTGSAIAQEVYPPVNLAYNTYKIGRAYDRLSENPYQGSGSDVIARMKNHNGERVILQRGEAIPDENGLPVVYGKDLKRETGTLRNFGMDKGIYKHNVSRADVQRIPKIIQQNPVETNQYGQNVYITEGANGELKIITSPKNGENIISSMYYLSK